MFLILRQAAERLLLASTEHILFHLSMILVKNLVRYITLQKSFEHRPHKGHSGLLFLSKRPALACSTFSFVNFNTL